MAVNSTIKLSELQGATRADAEFYQPDYLKVRRKVIKLNHVKIGDIMERCKKGIFDIKAEKYASSGIPFIRISNLKDGLIDETDLAFIPPDIHKREKKTEFHKGDMVLSKTAYPSASVIFFDQCNISQDIIGTSLKDSWKKKLRASYIVAFLNSLYGLSQMQQWFQGNIQMHLALPDVKRIVIPVLSKKIQQEVTRFYSDAHEHVRNSKLYYDKAEKLLLEGLQLNEFEPKFELSYSTDLSRTFGAHRIDAEHFQPIYDVLIQHINVRSHYTIRAIEEHNKRGVQPEYTENGKVRVVTSKHLGPRSINYENLDKTTIEEWEGNKNAQLKKFDILIYTTGANVGRTNCFLEDYKTLGSNHINILRIRKLNPLFVAVFLNSMLGQMQVKRSVSGSAQAELYPSDISKIVVWDAPNKIQRKIASLVQQSHAARKRAKELLNEARKKVEQAIEKEIP